MIALIVLGGVAAFALAYAGYGRMLSRLFGMEGGAPTPAHTLADGLDYCAARPAVLLGHHFSSIAGAGPIVGPVFATLVFGWGPSVLWIVLGSIFIGGVHDYGSLALSVKHRARSIAEVSREHMGLFANKLFLIFVWLTLVYVLVVFLDLTAATFAPRVPATLADAPAILRRGGGVATSSLLFIALAIAFGLGLYRFKLPLGRLALVFVPLVFLAVWVGQQLPIHPGSVPAVNGSPTTTWSLILVGYCLVASVAPVWILLQPRDFLSSFLLYACLLLGLGGVVASAFLGGESGPALRYPIFLGFHSDKLGYLFPSLFITIACGACSGFHAIVASGTTAKQLDRERDARGVGYGAMLIEGVLALIAVATVASYPPGATETRLSPPVIFATGLARFLALLGIPAELGASFALLSLSTFLLTTLDTATRLGRYILEELLGLRGRAGVWIGSLATIALPVAFSLMTFHDEAGKPVPVWSVIWPVFGSTNQLLGGLALLVITVWLRRTGRPIVVTFLPMLFMVAATMISLAQLVLQHGLTLIGGIAGALFVLAVVFGVVAARVLWRAAPAA
jgi:carbon starvation protein